MSTPLEYFRQFASEFNQIPDGTVDAWINSAKVIIAATEYVTEKSKLSLALYGAHLCWINRYPASGGGSRGNVISEKDDKLERKYRPIQGSDTPLGQSPYGQQYIELTGSNVRRAAILTRFGTGLTNGY